jgi:hypothetical protein
LACGVAREKLLDDDVNSVVCANVSPITNHCYLLPLQLVLRRTLPNGLACFQTLAMVVIRDDDGGPFLERVDGANRTEETDLPIQQKVSRRQYRRELWQREEGPCPT